VVTTAGTEGLKAYVPERDATIVARLRAAGAILLGKTNTPELTLRFSTDNFVYGRTNNPHDLDCTPAGSSGGAAAIVAACGAPFDVGSDTGGSIRIPAHCCGVVALKATAGRIPRSGHIPFLELGPLEALTQVGPLARRVEDLELILRVVSGPDGVDPAAVAMPIEDAGSVDVPRLSVAFYDEIGLEPQPTVETRRAVREAAAVLADAGASVEADAPPAAQRAPSLWRGMFAADGGAGVRQLLMRLGTTRMHPFLSWTQEGVDRPTSELMQLLAEWSRLRSDALCFLQRYDAIICPANATPAPKHEEPTRFRYAYLYNLLGWPVVVVPVGRSLEGLPIGVQVVAHPWREDVALAVAMLLEKAFGGWQMPNL
jgi:amidase